MCGRYTLTCPADEIGAEFGVDVPADYQPHYNIAPTQPVPIIGLDGEGEQKLAFVRWGLVPFWAESPKDVKHTINARAESLLLKPAFREAFLNRRCLVIADGFYEWQRKDGKKQPFRFHLHGDKLFAFAGVWERWKGEGEEPLYSCAIVTTAASSLVEPIHDRMPAILTPEQRNLWLNPKSDPVRLTELLKPYSRADLEMYPVSTRVNAVANDAPDLIEPASPVAGANSQ
jgi:putative SOS response-associated peptidase YedK